MKPEVIRSPGRIARTLTCAAVLITFSCGSGAMNVKDIQSGLYLNRATPASPSDFFQKRMQNRIRKANVGNWEILREDGEFVYFGYPIFAGLFSDDRTVPELFKVDQKALALFFPGYKTVTGTELKPAIYGRLTTGKPPACEFVQREQWSFQIADGLFTAIAPCKDHGRYMVTLNKSTGAIENVSLENK